MIFLSARVFIALNGLADAECSETKTARENGPCGYEELDEALFNDSTQRFATLPAMMVAARATAEAGSSLAGLAGGGMAGSGCPSGCPAPCPPSYKASAAPASAAAPGVTQDCTFDHEIWGQLGQQSLGNCVRRATTTFAGRPHDRVLRRTLTQERAKRKKKYYHKREFASKSGPWTQTRLSVLALAGLAPRVPGRARVPPSDLSRDARLGGPGPRPGPRAAP